MVNKMIAAKLRAILDRADIDTDGLINRKRSPEHNGELDILLEHISLLVTDLRFDLLATRSELFKIRCLLEE